MQYCECFGGYVSTGERSLSQWLRISSCQSGGYAWPVHCLVLSIVACNGSCVMVNHHHTYHMNQLTDSYHRRLMFRLEGKLRRRVLALNLLQGSKGVH